MFNLKPGQYETIKKLLIEPFITEITDAFPKDPEGAERAVWYTLQDNPQTLKFILPKLLKVNPDSDSNIYQSMLNSMLNFPTLLNGKVSLQSTFGNNTPAQNVLRNAIYRAIIEILHAQYPERKNTYPILEQIDNSVTGMLKIRQLFTQYITQTQSGSLERYSLAHEILLEKEKLGLPSYLSTGDNIFLNTGYAPGDFSYLDLSHLDFKRKKENGHGNFKGLTIKNCNCNGTTWSGLTLYAANFDGSSLKGAEFSTLDFEAVVLGTADVEGTYFAELCSLRNAKNADKLSKNREELFVFRKNKLNSDNQLRLTTEQTSQRSSELMFNQSRSMIGFFQQNSSNENSSNTVSNNRQVSENAPLLGTQNNNREVFAEDENQLCCYPCVIS